MWHFFYGIYAVSLLNVQFSLHQKKYIMTNLNAGILLLFLTVLTSTIHAQELRKNGSSWAKIESDGTVRINGSSVGRFESDGTIRVNGSSKGNIESDGTIRKDGSSVGKVESDGTVRLNGSSVGKIESDGTVRKNGSSVGSSAGVRKEYAAVLFFFDFY